MPGRSLKSAFSGIGNSSQCYGALGCLNITEDWFGLTRPVNLLPLDREVINTQFILRTRDSYGVRFLSTECWSQGRAKLRAFQRHLARGYTQLSPSLTPTLGISCVTSTLASV